MITTRELTNSKESLAIYYDPTSKVYRASLVVGGDLQRRVLFTGVTKEGVLSKVNDFRMSRSIQ